MKSLLPGLVLSFGLFIAGNTSDAAGAPPGKRPNILFVIADDWGFGHAGAYGCAWVKTPNFDRVAREGILFTNAYTPTAKCSPSRSSILTGRNPWQLGAAGNHFCVFPPEIRTFTESLETSGYRYASTGKVWGPGSASTEDGKVRNLAGQQYNKHKAPAPTTGISANNYTANFEEFLQQAGTENPWFFWYGGTEPHREYEYGSGVKFGGKKTSDIERVPSYWPDNEVVRNDILDYAFEVEHFDRHLGNMLALLERRGQLDDTLVVVTSDNGMPFPRVKGNTYENANHLPLAIRWPNGIPTSGRKITDYVSFVDLAPTFVEAAQIDWNKTPMAPSAGKSLLDILRSNKDGRCIEGRDHVIIGRERNDLGRPNDEGYPVRGIVKNETLYLENFEPSRWPACNPETGYMDSDGSPTKTAILQEHRENESSRAWAASFGMRPGAEAYDLTVDRDCMVNRATDPTFKPTVDALRTQLFAELKAMEDPRVLGRGAEFDRYPNADEKRRNFYNRYMSGELMDASWVKKADFEKPILKAPKQ